MIGSLHPVLDRFPLVAKLNKAVDEVRSKEARDLARRGYARRHRPPLLIWFAAKGDIALGVVEGMNTNAKLAIRKARGFRTYGVMETALYRELGRIPEPTFTHRFC